MRTEQFYRFLYRVVWPFFNLCHPVRTVGREPVSYTQLGGPENTKVTLFDGR